MEPLLRVAPEVRLRSSASGLRALLVAGPDDGSGATGAGAPGVGGRVATGIGSRGSTGAGPADSEGEGERPSLTDLVERARHAQESGDLQALQAIEEALVSLHLHSHAPRRRPERPSSLALSPKDRTAWERKAFRAALTEVSVFKRAERGRAKAVAETEADSFGQMLDVADAVIAQHRAAALDDEWNDLAGHHRVAVIAELDAEFAAAGSGCTCVDAGWDEDSSRSHVTVVARYPGIDIVAERGPGQSSSGRRMLRRRTRAERNALYLSGLASFALAAARLTISVAVAADDVHLLVVRPTEAGDGLEPIYVGTLSREAVTLRPALADPVPLLLGSAVRPMQFDGPAHDLMAVAPDADVTEIVRRCTDALSDSQPDEPLEEPLEEPVV